MAEHKTYTCDYDHCGTQDAIHLRIPAVDFRGGNPGEYLDGYIDLCKTHLVEMFPIALEETLTMAQRRVIWKKLQ